MSVERHSLFFVPEFGIMSLDVTQKIIELTTPLAEEHGLFVVDAEIKASGAQTEVWVYLDGEDRGVNLNECALISNELGFLIDANEIFEHKYRLNISSPGLSRPLSDIRQYRKNIGRKALVKHKSSDDYLKTEGEITQVTDGGIIIKDEQDHENQIPFSAIIETKIIPQI